MSPLVGPMNRQAVSIALHPLACISRAGVALGRWHSCRVAACVSAKLCEIEMVGAGGRPGQLVGVWFGFLRLPLLGAHSIMGGVPHEVPPFVLRVPGPPGKAGRRVTIGGMRLNRERAVPVVELTELLALALGAIMC